MRIYRDPVKYYDYVFEFEFSLTILDLCRHIKDKLGFKEFGFYEGRWRFNNLSSIEIIRGRYENVEIADDVAYEFDIYVKGKEIKSLMEQQSEKIKCATKSSITIKNVKGELKEYQKIGVEFLMATGGTAIIGDEMGLGKSLEALAFAAHQDMKKILIIPPASVKYVWENEVRKWTKLTPLVITSHTELGPDVYNSHDVFIINYDILKKHVGYLTAYNWDCLILDEFHYIKSNTAQRTRFVKTIARRIPSKILLSGTPILSRPVELYNGLNLIDPYVWNDWHEYTKKYCDGHQGYFGWDARGATNISELHSLISKYFLRRTKSDVLKELPPKQYVDIPVSLEGTYRGKYDKAERSFKEYLRDIKMKTSKEIARTLQAEKLTKLGELRKLATDGKVDSALSMIEQILDSDQKVVVFSVYNEPLELIKKKLGSSAIMLTGKTDIKERREIIKAFQEDENIKVFLGGMKSAGVGITLTSAPNVLFIDYSWVPADHDQAADRIHRIGQKSSSITIYQLRAKDTIDDYMAKILEKKKKLFNKLIGGETTSDPSNVMNELLKMIEEGE